MPDNPVQVEILENHIEALPFPRFRELARRIIAERGYQHATISDGWSDGGRDVKVYRIRSEQPLDVAFQASVEWDWKTKLWADLLRAKKVHGCHTFVYVASRRVADAEFQPFVTKALESEDVNLGKIDKQDIAQQLVDAGLVRWFVDFMGLAIDPGPVDQTSLRREVSDSFVVFSSDAQDFRTSMLSHALITIAAHYDAVPRAKLIQEARDSLGVPATMDGMLEGAADRLLTKGVLMPSGDLVALKTDVKEKRLAMMALVHQQYNDFLKGIRIIVDLYSVGTAKKRRAIATERIAERIGSIVHAYRDYQVAIISTDKVDSDIRRKYIAETSQVRSLLESEGIKLSQIDDCMRDIAGLESKHSIVARLTAGEVFRKLLPAGQTMLLNALGRTTHVVLYLEPSVMIPLICIKLYQPIERTRFSSGVKYLYENARVMGFPVLLPNVYLEELAAHVITAGYYSQAIKRNPLEQFKYSDNAFVSYYAHLNVAKLEYEQFLRSFGYQYSPKGFDDQVFRATTKLTSIMAGYGISVCDVKGFDGDSEVRKRAEEDLAHIHHQLGMSKPYVLVRDDVLMLGYIREQSLHDNRAHMLVTWDHSMQMACQGDQYQWWCLDPSSATDLLTLVSPSQTSTMGIEMALSIEDRNAKLAAKVWDTLIRIEQEELMYDATLMEQAEAFRESFLAAQTGDKVATQQIIDAWNAFKELQNPASSSSSSA